MGNKLSSAVLNNILKGSNAQVWFNGQELLTAQKLELKMTANTETIEAIGDGAEHTTLNGWAGSGTMERLKVDSSIVKLIVEAIMSGVIPECEMMCLITNPSTGKRERCRVGSLVFTEVTILALENRANISESFPFNFSDFQFLETI